VSDEKASPDAKLIGGVVSAVILALGSGVGGGYALRGSEARAGTNQDSRMVDARVAVLETLATKHQSEQERLVRAFEDATATNRSLRDAVLVWTERFGVMTERQDAIDSRVKALETRRR
jgi:hypothetical protein